MSYVLREIASECQIIFQNWADEHRYVSVAITSFAIFATTMICWCVFSFIAPFVWPEQIVFRTLSGTVKYQDDSLIPASSMSLELCLISRTDDETGHRRPAYLLVDCSTGFFTGTIQTLGQLKQQEYLYRVVVRNAESSPLSTDLIPEQLSQPHTSTMTIDVTKEQVALQIQKPPPQKQLVKFANAKILMQHISGMFSLQHQHLQNMIPFNASHEITRIQCAP